MTAPRTTVLVLLTPFLRGAAIQPGCVRRVDRRISLRTAALLDDAGTRSAEEAPGAYPADPRYGVRGTGRSSSATSGPGDVLLGVPATAAAAGCGGALPRGREGDRT